MIAILIILLLPSVILYVEPSFPITVLGVYLIEVIMYASLFINHKRFQEISPPNKRQHDEIFQLEKVD